MTIPIFLDMYISHVPSCSDGKYFFSSITRTRGKTNMYIKKLMTGEIPRLRMSCKINNLNIYISYRYIGMLHALPRHRTITIVSPLRLPNQIQQFSNYFLRLDIGDSHRKKWNNKIVFCSSFLWNVFPFACFYMNVYTLQEITVKVLWIVIFLIVMSVQFS